MTHRIAAAQIALMRARLAAIAIFSTATLGCPATQGRVDEAFSMGTGAPLGAFDSCMIYTAREPSVARSHVAPCTDLGPILRGANPMAPPVGGTHFDIWANFERYTAPVPWGFLVHSMEHGAVVLAYRCSTEAECTSTRAQLEALIDARPMDPACRGDARRRVILVPEPTLDWPIAVLAWENMYLATCIDTPSITRFIDAHYAQAPENLCADGVSRNANWCPSR